MSFDIKRVVKGLFFLGNPIKVGESILIDSCLFKWIAEAEVVVILVRQSKHH